MPEIPTKTYLKSTPFVVPYPKDHVLEFLRDTSAFLRANPAIVKVEQDTSDPGTWHSKLLLRLKTDLECPISHKACSSYGCYSFTNSQSQIKWEPYSSIPSQRILPK